MISNFHYKIYCCQSCSYKIAYAVNNEGFFIRPTQGPYILQLCIGPSYFWGSDPSWPPLFRTLNNSRMVQLFPVSVFVLQDWSSRTIHTILKYSSTHQIQIRWIRRSGGRWCEIQCFLVTTTSVSETIRNESRRSSKPKLLFFLIQY